MLVLARLIASRYMPRIGNIHSRGTLRCNRICGSQTLAVSTQQRPLAGPEPAPPVQVPEVGEGPRRSWTPGPVIRTCVSRHSVSYADPML